MDTLQVRIDTTGTTYHIRSILQLKDLLQRDSKSDGLNFHYSYYKNDNHSSVPLITEYDALHFLFDFYKVPMDMDQKIGDIKSKFDPAAALTAHYADVSRQMGYTILPDEDMVNQLGYYYMGGHAAEKAYAMFAMNIKNYPKNWNVYDSMGDYYANQKDKAKAREYYKKALAINDNPGTKKKLDTLEAKK
jgi:tetratricopeptide (TPR) repeat protein